MTRQVYYLPVVNSAMVSFAKVEGVKSLFWPGIILLICTMVGSVSLENMMIKEPHSILLTLGTFIILILNLLLSAGLIHMGIVRAKGQALEWSTMYFALHPSVIFHLIGLIILQSLIVLAPSAVIFISLNLLLINHIVAKIAAVCFIVFATVASIVIIVRMILSVAFIMDRNINPFKAIQQSFIATSGNFWLLLGALYLAMCVFTASALLFLIGLIWTIPFLYIWYGEVYLLLAKNNQA